MGRKNQLDLALTVTLCLYIVHYAYNIVRVFYKKCTALVSVDKKQAGSQYPLFASENYLILTVFFAVS